jgi:hypothetical protein
MLTRMCWKRLASWRANADQYITDRVTGYLGGASGRLPFANWRGAALARTQGPRIFLCVQGGPKGQFNRRLPGTFQRVIGYPHV